MYDLYSENLREHIAQLPEPDELVLRPEKNVDLEHLSCVLCGVGGSETSDPPEWLVAMWTEHAMIVRGLHETCRARHSARARSRHNSGLRLIDAARFTALTGRAPERDDLERANCARAGEIGHLQCGICPICSRPRATPSCGADGHM